MSDYSAKPSGSLARIGDYDLSSDDSDQNDEDETLIASKTIQTGAVQVNDIAVAEASPAETDAKSSASPVSGPEPPTSAVVENRDLDEFKKESGSNDDKQEEINEDKDSNEETVFQQTESGSADVVDKTDVKQKDSDSSADDDHSHSKSGSVHSPQKPQGSTTPCSVQSPASPVGDEQAVKMEEVEEPIVASEEVPDKKPESVKESTDSESSGSEHGFEKMDTAEKVEDECNDDEVAASNGTEEPEPGDKAADTVNPWETPRQEPVDGVVQPRTEPPAGKPTRHTNCLDFVLFTVVKDALKHKHSWPFQLPVDAIKLEIPEYHNIVNTPMDLRTIEKRLRNLYYWCAEDAIKDLNTLFDNCKKFNDRNDDIYIMCENIEGVVQRGLEWMPSEEKPADLADHHRRGMFSASTPSGKTKGPKQRGRKSTRGRKKTSLPRGASTFKDESVDDNNDDESSKVDSINFDDDDDTATEKDAESRAESVQPEVVNEEPKPSTSQPPSKKRKAENGEPAVAVKIATPATPVAAHPQEETPRRKNPNTLIEWKHLVPRWQGKIPEWQKFCSKLLNEIHSVKNKGFAQVFYLPVDPIKLKIYDYLEVITNPMDLQTIKKKLDFKQYAEPEEFVHDINLMVDNCCKYNPKGSPAHSNALELRSFFEQRWKLFPRPGVDPIIADSYINQNLVVNTDLIEDERINSYLSAVKAEEKKCAEKLEQLRSMSEGLYTIAMQRREAKLAGNTAPALAQNQLSQLEGLGISIKSTPMMIPELISPALSVRSSSRAPVPKIIDDIGPSPIKARKISKPRASMASNVSVPYTPTGNPRGRKPKKSGRPKKNIYSPATVSERISQQPPFEVTPYVSIYGRKVVGTNDKIELSERMASIPQMYITPILRIIQIGHHNTGKTITSLRSLCEEEIDFNDVSDDLVIELLDYLEMIQKDKAKAEQVRQELEVKAKFYGFEAYDNKLGTIPKTRNMPPPLQHRMRSDSPSPSASRTGNQSSDSDSASDDSSDDEPSRSNSNVAGPRRALELSGNSSSASTPAGPSKAQPAVVRPSSKSVASKPAYTKRTLSESSSSSDSNGSSSDSSDSDSEPS
ncbi:Bromo domain-containing protein [Caenorhabditis elegans]|uniref:Bromo domain-containing protein n=1 Tax=Caenorhabditis elegans TaxID=6239 RepID=Q20948_CAEEL|nr:Bromo domain-containing protein [Caenorhabditis elegans]CAA93475.1 Bromo domain-containing protein [Caenorhabditis elegans]|eukprot:NP_509771.1 BET (two bromodomains) family protein [Caenorhabditis elegans]